MMEVSGCLVCSQRHLLGHCEIQEAALDGPFLIQQGSSSYSYISILIISMLIIKFGKLHTTGEELIFPVVSEVLRNVLDKSSQDITEIIPLSNAKTHIQCKDRLKMWKILYIVQQQILDSC